MQNKVKSVTEAYDLTALFQWELQTYTTQHAETEVPIAGKHEISQQYRKTYSQQLKGSVWTPQ